MHTYTTHTVAGRPLRFWDYPKSLRTLPDVSFACHYLFPCSFPSSPSSLLSRLFSTRLFSSRLFLLSSFLSILFYPAAFGGRESSLPFPSFLLFSPSYPILSGRLRRPGIPSPKTAERKTAEFSIFTEKPRNIPRIPRFYRGIIHTASGRW